MARESRGRYRVCFAFFSQSPALQNSCYLRNMIYKSKSYRCQSEAQKHVC